MVKEKTNSWFSFFKSFVTKGNVEEVSDADLQKDLKDSQKNLAAKAKNYEATGSLVVEVAEPSTQKAATNNVKTRTAKKAQTQKSNTKQQLDDERDM